MKFGRYLEDNVVPEWRYKYISYGKLKKVIRSCKEKKHSNTSVVDLRDEHLDPNNSQSPLATSSQSTDGNCRVPTICWGHASHSNIALDTIFSATLKPEEREFFQFLEDQVAECNDFYVEQLNSARENLGALSEQCDILAEFNSAQIVVAAGGTATKPVSRSLSKRRRRKSSKNNVASNGEVFKPKGNNPRKKLAQSLRQYYRLLELIKNFRLLNQTALRKILKKYEKATGFDTSPYVFHSLKLPVFHPDSTIDPLISETEQLYIDHIIPTKNRKDALNELRIPINMEEGSQARSWRAGMLTGIAIPLVLSIIRSVWDASPNEKPLLFMIQIWGGLSIPIFFLYLFSFTVYVWHKYRINWILIFELDPRHSLSPAAFAELASTILFLYSVLAYATLSENLFRLDQTWYPILLLGFGIAFLVNPFPILYHESRQWIVSSLGRVVLSGILPVQFRDFFICDLMSSLTYSFVSIQASFCILIHSAPNAPMYCSLDRSWGPSLVAALPAWWRLCQCFRRYYDDRKAHPHMTNALKYVLSISVILLSLASKFTEIQFLQALWIALSLVATLYSFLWDVIFDWGLLANFPLSPSYGSSTSLSSPSKNQHLYLRPVLTYPPSFYYISVVVNFFLRFSWVFLLAPTYWSIAIVGGTKSLVYTLAILEVGRRCMWAILRMENEHCNNVGHFRAVKELPLPFTVVRKTDEEEV